MSQIQEITCEEIINEIGYYRHPELLTVKHCLTLFACLREVLLIPSTVPFGEPRRTTGATLVTMLK